MPRYALVRNNLVENVILADRAPADGVLLADGQPVSPGDGYDGTTFAPRVRSVAEIERTEAPARLQRAVARMAQIATQADALAGGPGVLTAGQTRVLCAAVADVARALRALLIREFDE